MKNDNDQVGNQKEIEEAKVIAKDAETSITLTLYMGLFLGLVPVVGYPIFIPEIGGRIIFIGLLLALASFIASFFIGTLFGMPKRNKETGKENDQAFNNSLVDVSDWLTKIMVGLGLINLKEIPSYFINLGEYVSASTKYKSELLNIYTIGTVIYFGFLGLYIGYNYMRLVLSNKYKKANERLIYKALEEEKEKVIKIKEDNDQKNLKINQIENILKDKEQITKVLLKKINEPEILQINKESIIKKMIASKDVNDNKKTIEQYIDKMVADAKLKLQKGLTFNDNDPQNGQWGKLAIHNERQLTATVIEEAKGLYKIKLKVISTNPDNPLDTSDLVLFALHNTFGAPPFRLIKVENQSAELDLYSYESFTIGAFVDKGTTELELNLAELPNVSYYFKNH
ncbi:pYEATS domain-containing protein [Flavobacterium aestivum]|uniref:pYEATS domain-containing protein n=1 Tax=Flavobacterium aestivum TaxID=3003257 RepID=UPI0024829CA6|nr:pYEATS domain-containing protein [Flavobacterium aestivum]